MNKSTTRPRKSDRRDPETRAAEEGKRALYKVIFKMSPGNTDDSAPRALLDDCRARVQRVLAADPHALSARIFDDAGRTVEWWLKTKKGPRAILTAAAITAPRVFPSVMASPEEARAIEAAARAGYQAEKYYPKVRP